MRSILTLLLLFLGSSAAVAEPFRVATLLPYVEDALRGVPEARVVAAVRRTAGQPPSPGTADLGTSHAPNLEQLAMARAQVAIGDERIHQALRPKLGATGAEVLLVRADSVEATLEGLLAISRKVGAETSLAPRIAKVRTDLASLKLKRPVDTVVLFGAPGSFLLVTSETWLGDLLASLGFRNLVAPSGKQTFPGYVAVNDEVLASLRPQLVLLVTHGDPVEMERAFRRAANEREAWRGLTEARQGIHVLPPDLFSANPGLRLGEAARRLIDLADGHK
jgi:iron complex transport system substrate-binding protein